MTFNVHHGVGPDRRHDLPRLATVLARADADVVCLQEVDRRFGGRSDDVDQALLLSRALDMHLAWGPALERPDGGSYGNALLSRLPLLISDVHPLPGEGERRVALRTLIELDGAALWVISTHLSASSGDERAAQVAALAALHTGEMATGVLVGDLNAEPGAPETAVLRERFTDAWTASRDHSSRATHPASAPRSRIDQVWVSDGVAVAGARVLEDAGASDHLPVVVDLEVRSGVWAADPGSARAVAVRRVRAAAG